uniref:DUF5872 domain-containing protein n=1 Tax=viral metagenome TaxID=1070528 RepID=A0A6C0E4H3_9ZZZZ
MPKPIDSKLYSKVKAEADKMFASNSGIYKSSWIVREYKKRGGKYDGSKPKSSGLKRWYKENWLDLNRPIKSKSGKIVGYEKCGRADTNKDSYPLCRPSVKVSKKTPKTYKEISKKSIEKAKLDKRKVKGKGNIKFGGSACGSSCMVGGEANITKDEAIKCFYTLYKNGLYSEDLNEFKKLYKKWMLKNHPDKNDNNPNVIELVKVVNNCVSIATSYFEDFQTWVNAYKAHKAQQAQPQPQPRPQPRPQPQPQEQQREHQRWQPPAWKPTKPQQQPNEPQRPEPRQRQEQPSTGIGSRPINRSTFAHGFPKTNIPAAKMNVPGFGTSFIPSTRSQFGGKPQFYGRKSSMMVPVPKSVARWAEYAFKLKELGFKGARETGWKRAKQLSTKDTIPIEDLRYMRNWYARHRYTSYPGFKEWIDAGRPKDKKWHNVNSIISWVTWGGDAGFRWVNSTKTINLLNKHFSKSYEKIKRIV